MENRKAHNQVEQAPDKPYPYDAIVVLPYTRVERNVNPEQVMKNIEAHLPGPRTTHDMSHFTARALLAGWELYDQKQAPKLILPGEQKDPSTADLEKDFLVNNRKVSPSAIETYPNLNGTLQQLEPIAKLQEDGRLGPVKVVAFEFHKDRAQEIMGLLGIKGGVAEVEQTHADYLRQQGSTQIDRDRLVNLPQIQQVKRIEGGPVCLLWQIDRKLFGARAPITRLLKRVTGATVTDIRGYEGSTHKPAETLTYFPRWKRMRKPVKQ